MNKPSQKWNCRCSLDLSTVGNAEERARRLDMVILLDLRRRGYSEVQILAAIDALVPKGSTNDPGSWKSVGLSLGASAPTVLRIAGVIGC